MPVRPQLQYNLRSDNSQLTLGPSQDQINAVYSFCQEINSH